MLHLISRLRAKDAYAGDVAGLCVRLLSRGHGGKDSKQYADPDIYTKKAST